MLKVSENVNGKFDILLSDGYRTQLHTRGKASTKSDLNDGTQTRNRTTKTTSKSPQDNQGRSKTYNKSPVSKNRKSSKIPARSDGRLSGKKTLIKNKYGLTLENSNKIGKDSTSKENAAFVTKSDLASLLEALINGKDIPAALTKAHQTTSSDHVQDKETSFSQDKITTPIKVDNLEENVNQNVELTENQHQKLESIIESMTQVPPSITCVKDTSTSYVSLENKKPSAMRSSFAIGAPGLVTNDLQEDKVARHKHWMKELVHQCMHEYVRCVSQSYSYSESSETKQTCTSENNELQIQEKKEKEQSLKKSQSSDFVSQLESARNGNIANKTKTDNYSIRTVGEISQQHQEQSENSSDHFRGRGLMNIMLSTDEAQRQRKKIFEHQKAIELQVEDRKRQKREERERCLREDAMEEDRLAKQRSELQKQFQDELKKNEEKEEETKHRAHLLHEGISKAYESAQQLKREKRNRLQTSAIKEVDNKSSHNHDNQREQESNTNISSSDKLQNLQSNTLTRGDLSKRGMVPPLALSRSYSPMDMNDKPNKNTTSRISDSMLKIKPDSLSVREVKTSYSDPGSLGWSHDLIHKWVKEDVGSCSLIDNKNHVYNESSDVLLSSINPEVLIPFHRTGSATFTAHVSSQENNDSVSGNEVSERYGEHRKHHKKDRPIPEVHPTKTSLLRAEKATVGEVKNSSLLSRRYKETAIAPQKYIQEKISKRNALKEKKSLHEEKETNNTPTYLSSQYTPTPHQEKILEQLSALRKGLLLKDQELSVFQINS